MAPPIYVKGGVWTNVEDQILKAAVSKYGLTQWARVASLLPKKTAKQVKARWTEYLNPTINRTTWTRDDDEKLLGLAKLLPNQWRSISSIMGRTATHCVERYQKLLEDAARNKDGNDSESEDEEIADMKLMGPGIETLPALGNAFESLPSRPDAEEMADDEREMLSEAKARLANTQGKKAKRKDRERMLDESKRIALLQKRRELKAAGINVSLTSKNRARRKEFDYNADIPHERQPKPGIYDVTGENELNETSKQKFQKTVNYKGLAPMEKKEARESAKSKQAAEADSKRIKANTRSAAEAVAEIDAENQAKRRKLDLPEPGLAADIEEDAKKQRILAKSKDLLAVQNKANGIPLPEISQDLDEKTKVVKFSRKKVAGTLRDLLQKVPKPRETSQLVVPRFDPNEEILVTAGGPDSAQIDRLDLLKQVDEEKAHARRIKIIEKGLKVPQLSTIDAFNTENSPVLDNIKNELKALIKFDLEEDATAISLSLDEEITSNIEGQIEKELSNKTPQDLKENLPPLEPLPQSQEAISKVYDLLYELDASANAADQKSAVLEDTKASRKVAEELGQEIAANAHELLQIDLEERVLQDILRNEEMAIERRSTHLHKIVEDIKEAEARAARQEIS